MKGKPTRGRKRIQMLHDLANDDGYVALRGAAEDREGWRHREMMSKTCCTSKATDEPITPKTNYQKITVKGHQKSGPPLRCSSLPLFCVSTIVLRLFATTSDCFIHFYNTKINTLTENKLEKDWRTNVMR